MNGCVNNTTGSVFYSHRSSPSILGLQVIDHGRLNIMWNLFEPQTMMQHKSIQSFKSLVFLNPPTSTSTDLMEALDRLHKGKSWTHKRISVPFVAFIWDTKYGGNVQHCKKHHRHLFFIPQQSHFPTSCNHRLYFFQLNEQQRQKKERQRADFLLSEAARSVSV